MAIPFSLRGSENYIKGHKKERVKRAFQIVYNLRSAACADQFSAVNVVIVFRIPTGEP